jgi:hypothetical protein
MTLTPCLRCSPKIGSPGQAQGQGFASNQTTGAEVGTIVGTVTGIPGLGPLLGAIGGLVGSLFGATPVLTAQQIVTDVTPTVINNLQKAGLTLPPGQEQQYVQAALAGQLPAPQINYLVPVGVGGLALFLLLT